MKTKQLVAGKTYVGKNGLRRHLHYLKRDRFGRPYAEYDVPEGGLRCCDVATFARWAEREATADEAAP